MKTVRSTVEHGSGALLSTDTLDAMEELGLVLKRIYLRMQKEGYRIVDGKMMNINENEQEN